MEEIYDQLKVVSHLNEANKNLLDELFAKLSKANILGVYFIDLAIEYGEPEVLEANADLIKDIKKMGVRHNTIKQELQKAQEVLAAMCHDKFNELSASICEGDRLMSAYLAGEYRLAVSLGGVIPFLEKLCKSAKLLQQQ